ncbi:MAG: hypothetical protein ACP5VS_17345 [Desulfomonilaceae bacterium]
MITLNATGPDGTVSCVVLSNEEERIARRFRDLFFIEGKLLEVALCEQSLEIDRLNGLLCRALKVVEFEKSVLQRQWKDLHNCDKQVN